MEGKAALEKDNLTEHLNTINIFQRFNIHQVSQILKGFENNTESSNVLMLQEISRLHFDFDLDLIQIFHINSQELFLASLYRIYNFRLEPIFFYVEAVFSLQGFLMSAFFLIAWHLSGTWLAGVLTSAFIICNRLFLTDFKW